MGQDREFTQEEKDFAISTVQEYSQSWFDLETKCLTADVTLRDQMH